MLTKRSSRECKPEEYHRLRKKWETELELWCPRKQMSGSSSCRKIFGSSKQIRCWRRQGRCRHSWERLTGWSSVAAGSRRACSGRYRWQVSLDIRWWNRWGKRVFRFCFGSGCPEVGCSLVEECWPNYHYRFEIRPNLTNLHVGRTFYNFSV